MVHSLRRWLLVVLALLLGGMLWWPRPALGAEAGLQVPPPLEGTGARLFAQHCVGCHVNGGNILRRGKTLRLAALRRAGLEGPEAVARVAAGGQGQMGGYGAVLGPEGTTAVGAWVWEQALADWPKPAAEKQNLIKP